MEHISKVLKRVELQTVRNAHTMQIAEMTLYCPVCDTWTKHVISNSGRYLVCGCGEQIEYHAEEMSK